MKLIYKLVLLTFFLSGCASTGNNLNGQALQYAYPEFDLVLRQEFVYEPYPDQKELSKMVLDSLTEEMKAKSIFTSSDEGNTLKAKVTVDYRRIFVGEGTPIHTSAVGAPEVKYTITVTQGEKTIAVINKHIFILNGFLGNLKTTFMLGLDGTPEKEQKNLASLAQAIARDLESVKIP